MASQLSCMALWKQYHRFCIAHQYQVDFDQIMIWLVFMIVLCQLIQKDNLDLQWYCLICHLYATFEDKQFQLWWNTGMEAYDPTLQLLV